MKNVSKILLASILSVGIAATATAHDPKMHAKKAKKADCSVMDKMNKDKMMKKDPVLMAMMKKCMKQAKAEMMEHKMEMKGEMKGKMDHKKMEMKENKEQAHDHH